jgi:hypothetical protein
MAREEMQQQAWYAQVRSIVTEVALVSACIGQAQLEAAEAKREAKVTSQVAPDKISLHICNILPGKI